MGTNAAFKLQHYKLEPRITEIQNLYTQGTFETQKVIIPKWNTTIIIFSMTSPSLWKEE